jgi:hypothetical protein
MLVRPYQVKKGIGVKVNPTLLGREAPVGTSFDPNAGLRIAPATQAEKLVDK